MPVANIKKLLVICGPTATGKTSLAIGIANKFKGEIISADSRQVYKGMDIGTGKNLPKNSKFEMSNPLHGRNSKLGGNYKVAGVPIWGYDLVEPKKRFSVAQYIKFTRVIIGNIIARNNLPILVGGTGLYIKGLVNGIPTAYIRPNVKLRKSLAEKTAAELFEILANTDSLKAASLNISDRQNPRRLTRAIEVALYLSKKPVLRHRNIIEKFDALFIGLSASNEVLHKKIDRRVDERIKKGIEQEISRLIKDGVSWKQQSMYSLGYRQWRDYFNSTKTRQETIDIWKAEEKKYAKRQLIWFKKDKRINWFNIGEVDWQKNVEKLVGKWYISKVKR